MKCWGSEPLQWRPAESLKYTRGTDGHQVRTECRPDAGYEHLRAVRVNPSAVTNKQRPAYQERRQEVQDSITIFDGQRVLQESIARHVSRM